MTHESPLKRLSLFLFILLLSLEGGCGYTQKTVLPSGMKTLAVNTFQNKIPLGRVYPYEPGLEIKITNAVIHRFHRDGNLKVVSQEKADALLEGELIAYDQEGIRFTGLERIEEYRVYVAVAFRLRDPKTKEVLWEEPNFSGDASYFVVGPRATARAEAADRAIDRLARNLVDRVVEDW